MSENAEIKSNAEQVTPAPVIAPVAPVAPVVPVVVAEPVDATAENNKKSVAAFIKQRHEIRDLKRELANAKQGSVPPAAPAQAPAVAPQAQPVAPAAQPAAMAEVQGVNAQDEQVAIQELATDKDVMSIPGALIDIIAMVDNDPKLARLNAVDSKLAFQSAKGLWLEKSGIAPKPITPIPNTNSSGSGVGKTDLAQLYQAIDKVRPGTKEFSALANQIKKVQNGG